MSFVIRSFKTDWRLVRRLSQNTSLKVTKSSMAKEVIDPQNQYEDANITLPGQYCLQIGSPGPSQLKSVAKMMQKGMISLASKPRNEEALQYSPFRGSYFVREELAKFLTRQYGQVVDKANLFVTCGATAGLDLLLKTLFGGEHVVFIENPTYMIFARQLIREGRVPVAHVSVEEDGMNLDDLEKQVLHLPSIELTQQRPFRAAVYCIATHHNPTGCCLSEAKSKRLVRLARDHQLLVITDDVYNALNYEIDPADPEKFAFAPQRLFAYDDPTDPDYQGNVVSNGSFSKIAGPGLRLGWYELPTRVGDLLKETYFVYSGSGMSVYLSNVMAEALANGDMDQHLRVVRKEYKERMDTLKYFIDTRLAKFNVSRSDPKGGVFLWVILPKSFDVTELYKESENTNKVTFLRGIKTSVVGDFKNCLRLSIAFYRADELRIAMEGLYLAIEKLAKTTTKHQY